MAKNRTVSYSASQVIITINGILIEGYGEDTFLELIYPAFSEVQKGADGEFSVSYHVDHSIEANITLRNTAPSSALIRAAMQAAKVSAKSMGVFNASIVNTTDTVTALNCVPQNGFTLGRAKNAGETVYNFMLLNTVSLPGFMQPISGPAPQV